MEFLGLGFFKVFVCGDIWKSERIAWDWQFKAEWMQLLRRKKIHT